MYFVVRGECEIVEREGNNTESNRRTYGVGDHFGQISLIIPDAIQYKHLKGVRAVQDTTLISLKRKTLFYHRELSDRSMSIFLKAVSADINIEDEVIVKPASCIKDIENYIHKIRETAHQGGAGAMHKAIRKRASETFSLEADAGKATEGVAEK